MAKRKLAMAWAAGCGGCEVAVLDTGEKILSLLELAEFEFWPVALDFKLKDLQGLPDGYLDFGWLSGAIRTSEQEELAHLLRRKSRKLVAFGACACWGGIPGLANLTTRERILARVFKEIPSVENPGGVLPRTVSRVPEGELYLPEFSPRVLTLDQVTAVDYLIPGCPPRPETIWEAVSLLLGENPPAPPHAFGSRRNLCAECPREKPPAAITELARVQHTNLDGNRCLVEQGVICLGPATRGGCGARCIKANMPCRGCYGPAEEGEDQGAKMIGALAAVLAAREEADLEKTLQHLVDPVGLFYRFCLPASILGGSIIMPEKK
ncbi:MAG: oxidoreductase [bacterium]|nr:oxidoreductase [bacterium]